MKLFVKLPKVRFENNEQLSTSYTVISLLKSDLHDLIKTFPIHHQGYLFYQND